VTDEQQLVESMRRGDQRAFDQFFAAYARPLGSFAARRSSLDTAAIEDVVQATMINAMRNLASFRGDAALFTWLCQICRNQLADVRRKSARQPEMLSLDAAIAAAPMTMPTQLVDFRDPLDECAADSGRSAVRRAVNGLPPRYARILELRYGDELALSEIARLLQLSTEAAESLLARAKKAFRERWVGDAQDVGEQTSPGNTGARS